MTLGARPHAPGVGRLVGDTLLGAMLVAAGLVMAYLAIGTPFVPALVPSARGAGGSVAVGLGVWSFALIAGGAMLVAGTSWLAVILGRLRGTGGSGGPASRVLGGRHDDLVVLSGFVPNEGRPIQELVIGAFGAVVIHELPASRQVRLGPTGWESRSGNGWLPIEDPLDGAMRDAERVRRWLTSADLDFVVRVYAALVVTDRTLQRSATCAVVRADQIPSWIASLPRQRTLTAGRRARLLALTKPSSSPKPGTRGDW